MEQVSAHEFRLAQTRRLLRYCHEQRLDPHALIEGRVSADLSPICDAAGRVLPDAADLHAIRAMRSTDRGLRWLRNQGTARMTGTRAV